MVCSHRTPSYGPRSLRACPSASHRPAITTRRPRILTRPRACAGHAWLQARVRDRHRTLPALWRALEDYRRHRRSLGDRPDPQRTWVCPRALRHAHRPAPCRCSKRPDPPLSPRPASTLQPAGPRVLRWRNCPGVPRARRAWRMSGPSRKREVFSANSRG